MCHIPLFCWITATVLEDVLKSTEERELPRTLTQIYSHYVVFQNKVKTVKFDGGAATDRHWSPQSRKMMESLGKLAFEQLQKGKLIFYESDLTECGMDLRTASVCSGVFTQVFIEESSLYQDKVFTFIHLSLQEFLAALHVHQTFISSKVNLLEHQPLKTEKTSMNLLHGVVELNLLHQSAVDEALRSLNGHLDLFLRFLLGLSLPTNQRLLQSLLTQTGSDSQTNQKTVKYIKEKLSESLSTERSINLFHCLNEMNAHSLLEQIQQSMRSGCLSTKELSPAQWSALVFILLSSQEHLDVFDLKSFSPSEEAFLKLLPVIKASKKAELSSCGLSERSCAALSSVLSSQSSSVKHLDLSNNHLQDFGVELLCGGLKSPHCKLDSLRSVRSQRLKGLNIFTTLTLNVKHLDLSNNDLQDSGVMLLCEGLKSPHCKLDSLRSVGSQGIKGLNIFTTLTKNVKHLDLSNNHLQDLGVKLLCDGLKSPHCKLDSLRLSSCGLSERSCAALSSVLSSQSSSVKHLDLSNNDLQDSGVKLLCKGLKSPHCKLDSLNLLGCVITEVGGASLAAALSSNSSSLTELDLSYNHPGDSAVKLLSQRLHTLRLRFCGPSERSCAALSSVLSSQSSSVKHLDLSNNDLQDSGVKLLCEGLKSPHCKLDFLSLSGCLITEVGGASLAAALSSNSSSVRELDLSYNHPGDSAVKLLSQTLHTLR
uniref:Uncharacterized protein n=1 Tax=Gouania willdenowi TaxID=441366 RepID=A0A8C5GJ40_GOUWI